MTTATTRPTLTTTLRTLCVLLVVATVATSGLAAATAPALQQVTDTTDDETVTMHVSDEAATVGETVTAEVAISGDSVAGYEALLTYDPKALTLESVDGADFATPTTPAERSPGSLKMTQSEPTAVDADPVLVEVTFLVESAGTTTLGLDPGETVVNDAEGTHFEVEHREGSITASDPDDPGGAMPAPPAADDGDVSADGTAASDVDDDADATGADDDTEPDGTDETDDHDEPRTDDARTDDGADADEDESDRAVPGFGLAVGAIAVLVGTLVVARRR